MKILVTGSAGFIGYHLCKKLLEKNFFICSIDNVNSYYDTKLKKDRLKDLSLNKKFIFNKIDLSEYKKISNLVIKYNIKYIIHLAAQAGVRESIKNPEIYFQSNIKGFFNMLEVARLNKIKHLIFASTSSVYGETNRFPINEKFNTDHPLTFYAASKKTNEVMAYSYSNIYKLPTTALRFFTVYGPFGRPDMALFKFVDSIVKNKNINLFNNGNHTRDFTYVDDITKGIISVLNKPSKKKIPYNCFNIGSNTPISLSKFIKVIEKELKKKAFKTKKPYQLGDIKKTHSDITKLRKYNGYKPKINIEIGIKKFVNWYINYY